MTTPEDAVKAMRDLTRALQENTKMQAALGQQLFIANQIAAMSNQRQGAAAAVKTILSEAARIFARGA